MAIDPNPSNMCVACLRTHVDITAAIPKQAVIYFCRNCERYLQPPNEWVKCALESRELLAFCIKRVRGLKDVKLVDAGFIWTEPHSKRLKVKLTVHGDVVGGATLQQVFVVEFTVNNQMCDDCHRTEAKDYWKCVVQVRQRPISKKTLYYLEQMILKHRVHENTVGIKPVPNGMDFFFHLDNHARKMTDFLNTVLPVKTLMAKKLISHDIHSNCYNYKYTYAVDVVSLSKDSLVCLGKKERQHFGGISPICLVLRVASSVHLIDPMTAQVAEINTLAYWRAPFHAMLNTPQLVEYTVMDVELVDQRQQSFPGQGPVSNRHVVADIWLIRTTELGLTSDTIHTRTHLGHLVHPGDTVMGYNLQDANVNNEDFDKLKADSVPDVVVVKKCFATKAKRKSRRNWKLKRLVEEDGSVGTATENDYNDFLEDLEEDVELRKNVNIFKDKKREAPRGDASEVGDEAIPEITLDEMLDDLVLGDVELKEES